MCQICRIRRLVVKWSWSKCSRQLSLSSGTTCWTLTCGKQGDDKRSRPLGGRQFCPVPNWNALVSLSVSTCSFTCCLVHKREWHTSLLFQHVDSIEIFSFWESGEKDRPPPPKNNILSKRAHHSSALVLTPSNYPTCSFFFFFFFNNNNNKTYNQNIYFSKRQICMCEPHHAYSIS